MVYVTIKVDTKERLHLSREPSIYSWALFGGFVALGFGAAYYGEDCSLWKIVYVMAGLLFGTSCMDDWEVKGQGHFCWKKKWLMHKTFISPSHTLIKLCGQLVLEDCDFDKTSGQIRLKKCSVWDRLLTPITANEDVVIASIGDVSEVNVQEENLNFVGKTHQVVLQFETGMSLQITKAFTFGPSKDHEEIAQKIKSFLGLESTTGGEVFSHDDAYMGDTSSTEEEEEDDFERIETAEVMDGINPDPSEDSQKND